MSAERSEAKRICELLQLDFGGRKDVMEGAHRRAEILAEMIRLYVSRELRAKSR